MSEVPLYIRLLLNVLLTESRPLLIDQRVIRLLKIGHIRVVCLILGAKLYAARSERHKMYIWCLSE